MANEKYAPLLEYLSENEEKLKIFLSADDKAKTYRSFYKAKNRKLKSDDVDKSNSALVSNLIYNMLLKERNKKC